MCNLKEGKASTNRRLAQWRVTWLTEHSASHQRLCNLTVNRPQSATIYSANVVRNAKRENYIR